ncbi:MAG: hypothetical protein HGN29_08725 [Asgard group archaeon]|nr:hypothetical protein [Asgard group archaeon]
MAENSDFIGLLIRIFNLFSGIIYIITAILLFAQINLNTQNTLLFISIILIFIGILRFINGSLNTNLQKYLRISRIIAGIIILALAVSAVARGSIESTAIILLAIAVLINSIQKSLIGVFEKHYPVWFRAISILGGTITIVLSLLVIFGTSWDVFILIILFAIVFLLNGVSRLINAISNPIEKKGRKVSAR